MILIRLFMLMFAVGFGALVVTQVIIPAIKGRTFFPLFQSRARRIESEVAEARRLEHEAELQREAGDKKSRAARIEVDTLIRTNKVHDDLIEAAERLHDEIPEEDEDEERRSVK